MDRPVPENRDMGFLLYGHEVLQVLSSTKLPVFTHPWHLRSVRRVVEVDSSSTRRLNHWFLKCFWSVTRLHILTTGKYQLNTYKKVNLFNRRVTVITTIYASITITFSHPVRGIYFFILLYEKLLQFDWLRAVVFQLNLKYLHVKITNLLRVVV